MFPIVYSAPATLHVGAAFMYSRMSVTATVLPGDDLRERAHCSFALSIILSVLAHGCDDLVLQVYRAAMTTITPTATITPIHMNILFILLGERRA